VDDVAGRFDLPRPVKMVVDCGNGVGSVVAVKLLERLGADVVPLYCESDGTFPNHHPDPTVDEYIQDLIERVRAEGAEVGVGFDGDADRIGAVDETGAIVRGDILLLLFALDMIEPGRPGQQVVFDVKCSQAVPEVLEARGGRPIMWMTGHSLMKEKMKETGAPLAGELSGHICFADDYYGFDDALYAACRLVDLLARSDRPLSG
jgi:phosphomannomutase / phosphoglucomutase